MSVSLSPVESGEFNIGSEEFDSVYYVDTFTKVINIIPSGVTVVSAVLVADDPVKSQGVTPSATPAAATLSGSYSDLFPNEEFSWTNEDLTTTTVTSEDDFPTNLYKVAKVKPDYTRSDSTTYTLTVNWIAPGPPPVPGVSVFNIPQTIYNNWDADIRRLNTLVGKQS